jgi:hypothetical protein
MAAKISADMSFDDQEDEIIFTRAALSADPDARDLLPLTDAWMAWVETSRARDREARIAVATAYAQRRVSNLRLDDACQGFAGELELAVKEDRKSPRWLRFFSGIASSASDFIRLPFAEQTNRVVGWLTGTDEVLERHRAPLTDWSKAAGHAITATNATAQVRGEAAIAREETAEALTRGRDGLEARLVERANERGLPRQWPKTMFKPRKQSDQDDGPPVPPV